MEKKAENNITYIDGIPYAVRLPDGGKKELSGSSEFGMLMRGAGTVDMHCDMRSWCSNRFVGTLFNEDGGYYWDAAGYVTHYDGRPENWSVDRENMSSYGLGFRPVLTPLDKETLEPDLSRFGNLPKGSLVRLGSLYMNDEPLPNPVDPIASPMPKYDGHPEYGFYPGDVPKYDHKSSLRIGDTAKDPAKQIQFVAVDGKLVADRVLLGCVTHDELEAQFHFTKDPSLIKGKEDKDLQKNEGPISLWMRLGVSIQVSPEELAALREDGLSGQEALIKLLCSGRCRIDGDTYFPEGQQHLEKEIGFDLPSMAFSAQAPVKERETVNEKASLADQILSAESRNLEANPNKDGLANDIVQRR